MNGQQGFNPRGLSPGPPMPPGNFAGNPNNTGNGLFVSPTISKDDTMGEESKERQILAAFPGRNRPDPRMGGGPPMMPPVNNPHFGPIVSLAGRTQSIYSSSGSDDDSSSSDGSYRRKTKAVPRSGNTWRKRLLEKGKGPMGYQADLDNAHGTDLADGNEETKVDLTTALGSIAYTSLGIDILNEGNTSTRYLAFLLDTIEKLQVENEFLEFETSRSKGMRNSAMTRDIKDNAVRASGYNAEKSQESPRIPRGQVIHRVSCAAEYHGHDGMMYEDQPELPITQRSSLPGETEGLRGKQMILNEASYLQDHGDISFLVIKEHICVPRSSKSYKRSSPGNSISPRMETLRIKSPILRTALHSVAECPLDEIVYERRGSKQLEMEAPYYFLYHHRHQLVTLSQNDPEAAAHIIPLFDYIDKNYGDEYNSGDELIRGGTMNSFHVRKLFKPNQIILKSVGGRLKAYVLDSWPTLDSGKLQITGWCFDYDGRKLVRIVMTQAVEFAFSDDIAIDKLEVYPLEYANPNVVSQLKARGERYWALRRRHLVAYSGWDSHRDQFHSQEQFMIDTETYKKMHGRFFQDFTKSAPFDAWPRTITKEEELPNDSAVLLPSIVHGFFFKEKKWKLLNVDQTHEVTWNKRAFKQLVLDQGSKELLEALINTRAMDDGKRKSIVKDFVKGKGNGCIILLHGSPGTGKTLTAESVAELAEKPLYRVTCADIGTDAPKVEEYLASVMYLGQKWDCVLLLDEADVFMEERVYSDLKNNSLVSVFLRVLEYYEGILILTSNRVDNMDEAFKSRIHFALTYDRLDKESRRQIWSNFLEMLEEDEDGRADVDIPQLRGHLDSLAGRNINGRQIRSALSTAQQLAAHREERLGIKHLEQVLKNLDRFNKHLNTAKRNAGDQYTGNVGY